MDRLLGEDNLEESLLSGHSSNVREAEKFTGADIVTPYAKAGFFSILSFSWIGPLISLGHNKKTLDLNDVPQLSGLDSIRRAFPILNDKLVSHSHGSGNQVTAFMLVKVLFAAVWKEILLSALFAILDTFASFVGPFLIDSFVQLLSGHQEFENQGYFLVAAFFLAKIVESLADNHGSFCLARAKYRVIATLTAKLYAKGLTLSPQSKKGRTTGEIINFVTVDVQGIGDFVSQMHQPWLFLIRIGLALVILYENLGLSFIITFVATVLVVLANVPLGKLQEKFMDNLLKSKDKRMNLTSEVLRNMRILKFQAWEMKFLSRIMELRKTESRWLKKYLYNEAIVDVLFSGAPIFVSVTTFGACMLMGIPFESGKILSALATFSILQEPIYTLPATISMIIQTKISLYRVASFLSLDDLSPNVVEKLPRGTSMTAIEIVDGNFTWDVSCTTPSLRDINLSISCGSRVAICGVVGSGKSSLLSCILGEMPKLSGTIKLCGTKAYVAQSPWIQSGTIEGNILFGKEMDIGKYDRVLEACALKKDLEILPFGDQTIIGERGINLSGGQKQRIQIARALYQDADIYLFDDPFSAVDAHTGSHIFNECILSLLHGKTVVYITHQVEFLPTADLILVVRDGKITQDGKYNDILETGSDFMELVDAYNKSISKLNPVEVGSASISPDDNDTGSITNEMQKQDGEADDTPGEEGQLVQEEGREKGNVGFHIYWKYLTMAYGGWLVPFLILARVLFKILQIGGSYWMAWATPVSKDMEPPVQGSTLILVYVALGVGSSLCILVTLTLFATVAYKTAQLLFNKMHLAIFHAPMSFFDATPSGRILNRASTDQMSLELRVPYQVAKFPFIMISISGIIVVMSQVAWEVFIVFMPVISICIWLQRYYIVSSIELTRLIGVCEAPIIQHFGETISGASTIRSFDQESKFLSTNMKLIDDYTRPNFHLSAANNWLSFRLDALSLFVFTFSLVFLICIPEGTVNPSVAGLAVIYGLDLNLYISYFTRGICQMENKMISVERILQYTFITSESPLVIESNKPKNGWPPQGEVDICKLQVRYAPHLPLVLRGLTCTFFGGKKSGIVGRTGSGKSTLIQALFRIVEPTSGQISIDGVNISSIGLHDLRSKLSIIPQDPTMFEGTVRSNLDPLEEYTDEQIWQVLEKCQLGDEVRKKEAKLDCEVSGNGENWSMGQRQLVCLGRVLLKKSKVLVLDEATASVDTATDKLIQQTIRQHFAESTVITIAHRITSVFDSDMVLVLDHGLIQEYDSPENLLKDKSSSFAKLVAEYTKRSSS